MSERTDHVILILRGVGDEHVIVSVLHVITRYAFFIRAPADERWN
jgi:hypothetical protein